MTKAEKNFLLNKVGEQGLTVLGYEEADYPGLTAGELLTVQLLQVNNELLLALLLKD